MLAKPFPALGLPQGFSSPRVSQLSLSGALKRRHAIGAVRVEFGEGRGTIRYVVFRSHDDAAAGWNDWVAKAEQGVQSGMNGPPPGLPQPAGVLLGVAGGRGSPTDVAFVSGTVLVRAITTVGPAAAYYDRAAAVALAQAANTHLRTVRR